MVYTLIIKKLDSMVNTWMICMQCTYWSSVSQLLIKKLRGRILGYNSCPYSIFFDQRVRLAQAFRTNKVEDDWILKWTVKFALWIERTLIYFGFSIWTYTLERHEEMTLIPTNSGIPLTRTYVLKRPTRDDEERHPWKSDSVWMSITNDLRHEALVDKQLRRSEVKRTPDH